MDIVVMIKDEIISRFVNWIDDNYGKGSGHLSSPIQIFFFNDHIYVLVVFKVFPPIEGSYWEVCQKIDEFRTYLKAELEITTEAYIFVESSGYPLPGE